MNKLSAHHNTVALTSRATAFFEKDSSDLNHNKIEYLEPGYQDHFSRSQEAIVQAIEGIKGTALILGTGSMNDIPLQNLAEQFDCVILVDVNLNYTQLALEKIPKDLQKKCSLLQKDLAGVFADFSSVVEKIAGEKLPYDEFISKVLDALPTLKRKELEIENDCSFISSSLVCSQLSGNCAIFLEKLTNELYKKSFEPPKNRENEFDQWLTQIQINHLDEMHRLLETNGKIYFADHFSAKGVCNLKSQIEERTVVLGESSYPGSSEVKAHLEKRFVKVNETGWTWSIFINKSKGDCSIENDDGSVLTIPVIVTETRQCQITALTLAKKI